jgi:hypothetical protein
MCSPMSALIDQRFHPRTWGAAGWASDLLPHLVYGLATATVYEALAGRAG